MIEEIQRLSPFYQCSPVRWHIMRGISPHVAVISAVNAVILPVRLALGYSAACYAVKDEILHPTYWLPKIARF